MTCLCEPQSAGACLVHQRVCVASYSPFPGTFSAGDRHSHPVCSDRHLLSKPVEVVALSLFLGKVGGR